MCINCTVLGTVQAVPIALKTINFKGVEEIPLLHKEVKKMICYEKSSLNAAAVAAQSVAANAFVSFPINNLLTGVAIKHPAGSSSVSLIRGLYLVSVNADVVPAAAGNVGLQLLSTTESTSSVINGAESVVTGVADTAVNISFTTLVRVRPSCCAVNNTTSLQVQATAAATINRAAISVVKLA